MLGIPVGSELAYKGDTSIVVRTTDESSNVEYKGKIYSMSALVGELKGGGTWQGSDYLLYNGKKLTALRDEMEKAQQE